MEETDIVTLDSEQKSRVEQLIRRYQNDELNRPEDLVDEWSPPKTEKINREYEVEEEEEYIDPTEIVGRLGEWTHFESQKAARFLSELYNGQFDQLQEWPPMLEKRPEGYFVTDDGTHRSIVAKAVPLDELYVEYYTVPASALTEK